MICAPALQRVVQIKTAPIARGRSVKTRYCEPDSYFFFLAAAFFFGAAFFFVAFFIRLFLPLHQNSRISRRERGRVPFIRWLHKNVKKKMQHHVMKDRDGGSRASHFSRKNRKE
jgi:hypothetical protein